MSGSKSEWAPKVFWQEVRTAPGPAGWEVRLDGRPVRTPARKLLVLPNVRLASRVAAEWRAQTELVRPQTMPATRMANAALDKLALLRAEVLTDLCGYGATDLICYRAEAPAALIARQEAGWDPLLLWAGSHLGARLVATVGIAPVEQPAPALAALSAALTGADDFSLAALHDLVAISGSLILALAVAEGRLTAAAAFALSRIDEHWQQEQWGRDSDAAAAESARAAAFAEAAAFLADCRGQGV